MFEASDEASHFRYADYLATERRLPDLKQDLPSHEVTQPVLYYALVAVVISPFDRSNLDQINQLNPDWFDKSLNADYKSVKNLHVHIAAEQWPWRGAVWAVHTARFFSSLLGALVILFVFLIARLLAPRTSHLAPLAAALVAFNPKFIHISSIVSNDVAITLAATATCWWIVRLVQRPAFANDRRSWFGLGVLCGLAVLCKLSSIGLLAPVAVLGWMGFRQVGVGRAAMLAIGKSLLIFVVGFVLVAGWWFAFNTLNYGNPLAWEQVRAANAALLRVPPLTLTQIIAALPRVLESFWGVVGIELDFPRWVNLVFFVGLALAIVGSCRAGRRKDSIPHPSSFIPLLAWQLALLVLFVLWLRGYVGTENGRLIMPGIAPLVIAVAAGWLSLVPQRWHKPVAFTSACALLALALATPFWVIRPAFAEPTYLTPQQVASLPSQNGPTFEGDVKLLHAQINQRSVKPDQAVRVSVFWGAARPIAQSYRVVLEAIDLNGDVIGQTRAIPFGGRFATQRWAAGQFFQDDYEIVINADAKRGAAAIKLSLFAQYPEPHVLRIDGTDAAPFEIGKIKIDAKPEVPPADSVVHLPFQVSPVVAFGGQIVLIGSSAYTGELAFSCAKTPDKDYTLFVHVLDAKGKLIAQQDGQPFEGRYPTRLWDAGDLIIETRKVNLEGAQRILIGWYDARTGERLPATKPDGMRWPDDAAIIWEATK